MTRNKLIVLFAISIFSIETRLYADAAPGAQAANMVQVIDETAANDSIEEASQEFFRPWMIAVPIAAVTVAATGAIAAPFLVGVFGAEAAGMASLAAAGKGMSLLLPVGAILL